MQHPCQNAFGDDLDPGGFADLRLAANAVAHGFAGAFAQGFGHAFRGGAGGQATWLQHDDAPIAETGLEHGKRYLGGLAGAGWGLQHGATALAQGGDQIGQGVINGQACHGSLIAKDPCRVQRRGGCG